MGKEYEDELLFIARSKNEDMVIFCNNCGSLMRKFNDLNKNERKYFCHCGNTKIVSYHKVKQKNDNNSVTEDSIDPIELKRWKEQYFLDDVPNFKCPKCGSKRGELKYKHMRAYSKPTNLFIFCSRCGTMVRKSN
ncbi:MAG: hypothetical protein GF311_26300 [Candidatus Lokiarchaeota archaeon]|nr:hypothetical protein [Candidatus Lokiarchaeota archaeon]